MNHSRILALAIATSGAALLAACNTTPHAPMAGTQAGPMAMASPNHMGMMDAQMKSMREMHDKMKGARTPEERGALMAQHMQAMQGGMTMMGDMGGMKGMADMKAMPGMSGDMAVHHQMMVKRMEMMQLMMTMMKDRMLASPGG